MKKILALLMIGALCLSAVACKTDKTNTPDGSESPTVAVTTPETDPPEDNSDEAEETTIEPETQPPSSTQLYFFSYSPGVCTISGYDKQLDSEFVIPSVSPEGDTVTAIEDRVFAYNKQVTSVTIPDCVSSIGGYAFHQSASLKTVTISGYGMTIGSNAFSGCPVLTDVTILDGVYFISSSAFSGCDALTNVTISDSVMEIGERAFASCSSLETLVIGKGVTSIDGFAFAGDKKLAAVYYAGSEEEWASINIGMRNNNLTDAPRYYYSETEPAEAGNYWHYVDGVVTKW